MFGNYSSATLVGAALLLGSCSLDDVLSTSSGGSGSSMDDKVVLGLKTALKVGIDSSSGIASQLNGYFAHKVIKILLPEEAAQALATAEEVAAMVEPFSSQLSAIKAVADFTPGTDKNSLASNMKASGTLLTQIADLKGISDSVVKYMNRAAEYAAPRSVPIFKGAITGMTISDGLSLLNSSDSTAATTYLNGKTFSPLATAYSPIVDSTLALVPLTQYWSSFRNGYNTVLANYQSLLAFQTSWNANAVVSTVPSLQVNKLKPVANKPIETESLGGWTTDKALVGLFYLVGEEERDIRRDPYGYVKGLAADAADILKEVFGEIMKMQ
ncbi:MAG: hypothetical protein JWP91_4067 [Fibrobacteres bacterium]|nr:hypothetical protein [Fibrobacterota bacterium]